jgi:hypothetical protein
VENESKTVAKSMKYRLLTDEELRLLEDDLKQFLVVNQVYKEEWEEMNKSKPDVALEMIELFSDNVLQIVYEKVKFLEHRTTDSCFVFNCGAEKLELIAFQKKNPTDLVDLSTPEGIHEALTKNAGLLSFFTNEKPYSQARETEIHQMLEQGCVNSTEEFWNALVQTLKD